MNTLAKTILMLLIFLTLAETQTKPTGSIIGEVIDRTTQSPLPGVNVILVNTQLGAATDVSGRFKIDNVPVGAYNVQFRFIGYEPVTKTDVIVASNRNVSVKARMEFQILEMESIIVTDGYFGEQADRPVSVAHFGYEEVRRSPGALGDVSRIMMAMPSVVPSGDMSNSLIVRGGNPLENGFYIDNIQIPNINHFPTQGQTSGNLGIINVEFIDEVAFFAGGFSSGYDNRLSSIVDISLREGSRERFSGQAELNFAGFGVSGEGPLAKGKGSWLFSARRSYLDKLVQHIDVGTTIAPRYGDMLVKAVYDLNSNHRISIIGLSADDQNRAPWDIAEENQMVYYGDQDIVQKTLGLNWRALWSKNGYSNTSLSVNNSNFDEDFYDVNSRNQILENRSNETTISLRNQNELRLNAKNSIKFGIVAQQYILDYNNYYGEYQTPLGDLFPELSINNKAEALGIGAFIDYSAVFWNRITANIGFRGDYFSYNTDYNLSPTLSLSYRPGHLTTISAAAGIYRQHVPFVLLTQSESNRSLEHMTASHLVLGVSHLLTESTRMTFEVYKKDYSNLPLDPNQGGLSILDETFYSNGFYQPHAGLVSKGNASTYGIEAMVQKKLAEKFYGIVSGSLFRSQYRDIDNKQRNRIFDNRFIATIEGGYKPNSRWEFSARWALSGGKTYTPFDSLRSTEKNRGILDDSKINAERYPVNNSINLRVDKRFQFGRSNIVAFLSVWNALNQEHIASYYWNSFQNTQDTIYQWRAMPIFGIEVEF
jgi:hypothetical protein